MKTIGRKMDKILEDIEDFESRGNMHISLFKESLGISGDDIIINKIDIESINRLNIIQAYSHLLQAIAAFQKATNISKDKIKELN